MHECNVHICCLYFVTSKPEILQFFLLVAHYYVDFIREFSRPFSWAIAHLFWVLRRSRSPTILVKRLVRVMIHVLAHLFFLWYCYRFGFVGQVHVQWILIKMFGLEKRESLIYIEPIFCAPLEICAACLGIETGRHLFSKCNMPAAVWTTLCVLVPTAHFSIWSLPPPTPTVPHVWRAGVAAILWSVWCAQNNLVFNATTCSAAHVLLRAWQHGCQYPDMYLSILRFYDTTTVKRYVSWWYFNLGSITLVSRYVSWYL
jgi:hypothetical protein